MIININNADFDSLSGWAEYNIAEGTNGKAFDMMLETWTQLDDDDRERVRGHGWQHLYELSRDLRTTGASTRQLTGFLSDSINEPRGA